MFHDREEMMKNVVGGIALVVLLFTSAVVATAKEVYLKDGGIIACTSFKVTKEGVVVLVNRDVLVTLGRDEVDMKRTIRHSTPKKIRKRQVKSVASTVPSAKEAKALPAAVKPAGAPAPASTAPPQPRKEGAAAGSAASAAPQGGAPAPGQGAKNGAAPPPKSGPAAGPAVPGVKVAPAAAPPNPPAKVNPPPAPSAGVSTPRGGTAAAPVVKVAAGQSARPAIPLRSAPPVPQKVPLPEGPMLMGFLVASLLFIFILVVANWKIFMKAGEAGWKCLIPIYNLFVMVQIAGKPSWWVVLLLVPGLNIIGVILLHLALSARFGKSPFFAIGLTLLGFIFYPILAFDRSEYR